MIFFDCWMESWMLRQFRSRLEIWLPIICALEKCERVPSSCALSWLRSFCLLWKMPLR